VASSSHKPGPSPEAQKARALLTQIERVRVANNIDEELAEDMAAFYLDPYSFVLYAFDWGKGDLLNHKGPDEWQTKFLCDIRDTLKGLRSNEDTINDALFYATKAGHGVGKSAATSWIVLWLMSTRPHFAGVVTANTKEQLTRKTWRELAIWHARCITGHWFKYNATSFHHVTHRDTWRFDATPWSEHNSEAFAGMHNGGRGQAMIFDEASGISDKIYEVAEGAMSDPDAFWFLFGNPTKRSGRFYEAWGKFSRRWRKFTVNALHAAAANKKRLKEMIEDWGLDSDYVRVRVLGEFPEQDVATLIPANLLASALNRPVVGHERFRPIWGLDVARFGDDRTALCKRRQRKLMSPVIFWQGLDLMQICARIKILWDDTEEDDKPASICVDSIGVGAGVVDRLNEMAASGQFGDTQILGINVSESAAASEKFSRLRDELWWRARNWFETMTVSMEMDVENRSGWQLEGNEEIFDDVYASPARKTPITDELKDILFSFLPNGKIKLEPKQDTKERLGRSPDGADAFVLTFADSDVAVTSNNGRGPRYGRKSFKNGSEWAA
jgi:hypothetical protein